MKKLASASFTAGALRCPRWRPKDVGRLQTVIQILIQWCECSVACLLNWCPLKTATTTNARKKCATRNKNGQFVDCLIFLLLSNFCRSLFSSLYWQLVCIQANVTLYVCINGTDWQGFFWSQLWSPLSQSEARCGRSRSFKTIHVYWNQQLNA